MELSTATSGTGEECSALPYQRIRASLTQSDVDNTWTPPPTSSSPTPICWPYSLAPRSPPAGNASSALGPSWLTCPSGAPWSNLTSAFLSSIDERLVKELADQALVSEATDILLRGPPAMGKTHLAIALALRAIENGYRGYFIRAYDLMEDLHKSPRRAQPGPEDAGLPNVQGLAGRRVRLLPLRPGGGNFLCTLVSACCEKGIIILTSNKAFGEWGELPGDSVIESAILDRLLNRSQVLNIRGESHWLREKWHAGLFSSHHLLGVGTENGNGNENHSA